MRPCLEASIALKTQEQYAFYLAKFESWARLRGSNVSWDDWIGLDLLVAEYLEDLAKEGKQSGEGEKILAAVVFEVADLRKADLRVASRALKGFQKLRPSRSRPPLPEDVTAAIAALMVMAGAREAALWVLTAHLGYFRPCEVFGFLRDDLIAPAADARAALTAPVLTVAPEERLVKSKTQTFDDSVRMDHPPWLGSLLLDLRASREKGATLFRVSRSDLHRHWRDATMMLGIGEAVLYQLRHGGASGDYLEGRRTLSDIAMRGRWRTLASVRRYTKAGRVQKVLAGLPPRVRPFVKWAHNRIEHIIKGDLSGMPSRPIDPRPTAMAMRARRRPSLSSSATTVPWRRASVSAASSTSASLGRTLKRTRSTTGR